MSFRRPALLDSIERLFTHPLFAPLIAFGCGSLAALSMAPLDAWPVLFVSIPALYMAVFYTASGKGAFLRGWLFGFGYFLFSLSWVGNALLVEGSPYQWAWPLAASGLPALLAFFPAFAALLSKKFLNLRSLPGWLGFISFYCAFEWIRGHIFTGFPWNLPGYTWADIPAVFQVLRLSDVYMLTWLTLLWASVPACFLLFNTRQKAICAGIGGFSFLACFAFGFWHLQGKQTYHEDLVIKLVQPNIAQSEKWRGDQMFGHFRKTLALSENMENLDKTTLIIWPETALNYRIFNAPGAAEELRSVLRSYPPSSALLTGMLRFDAARGAYYNSLVMIGDNAELFNIYDKHHLVPFGEYIPFQQWIPLAPVVQFKGFETGAGLKTMEAPSGVKYSPLICYEIVFPGRSMEQGAAPDFIVNVTNDAWYGESAGPYQHLTQALYRAVETGTPVIRAANTGFSAIISPYGRIEGKTELFKADSPTLQLPRAKPIPDMLQRLKYRLIPAFFMLFIFAGAFSTRRFANAD